MTGHWARRELRFLQSVAREVARLAPDRVALLTCGEGGVGAFVVAAGERSALDVAAAGARVAELLGGRGGGAGRVYQGKATELERREEAARVVRNLVT
jgi:alanyl-tRNA synthetase